jgi:hypothetical protein
VEVGERVLFLTFLMDVQLETKRKGEYADYD